MRIKPIAALLCLALAVGVTWRYRDAIGLTTSLFGSPDVQTPAEAGLHKCRVADQVLYTNSPCPQGHREQEFSGGTLSVVTMPKVAPPDAQASGLPNVRDMLVDKNAVDIRARQMEAIIDR